MIFGNHDLETGEQGADGEGQNEARGVLPWADEAKEKVRELGESGEPGQSVALVRSRVLLGDHFNLSPTGLTDSFRGTSSSRRKSTSRRKRSFFPLRNPRRSRFPPPPPATSSTSTPQVSVRTLAVSAGPACTSCLLT